MYGTHWEGKFLTATPPAVMILYQRNLFWMFPVTVLTKLTYWDFETSMVIMAKWELAISWKWLVVQYNEAKFITRGAILDHILDAFGHVVFKVIWRSVGAFFSNRRVTRKWLAVEEGQIKFGTLGEMIESWDSGGCWYHTWVCGTFDLVVFKILCGSYDKLVLKKAEI